jgi:hypothetical protein
MSFKFDPITGQLDLVGETQEAGLDLKICSIVYADEGQRNQRIVEIEFESIDDSSRRLLSVVSWLDVGKINQRISSELLSGTILDGQTYQKNYVWRLSGIRYVLDGFNYQLI